MYQLKSVTLRQVEYGKFFTSRGATDFSVLAFTEGMQNELARLNKALNYPAQSKFDEVDSGTVSAAVVKVENEVLFVFVHIQRRRENDKTPNSSMGRPYNQIRYTLLSSEDLGILFSAGIAVYYELLANSLEHPPFSPYQLKDYFSENTAFGEPERLKPLQFKLDVPTPPLRSLLYEQTAEAEIAAIQSIAQSIIEEKPVQFLNHKLEFLDKLLIAQAVQRLVYPYKGWITFDLYHNVVGWIVDLAFTSAGTYVKREIGPYVSWACQKFADKKQWFLVNQVFFDEDFGWLLAQVGDSIYLEQLEQFFNWISDKQSYDSVQAILNFCFQQQKEHGKDVKLKISSFFQKQPTEIQKQLLQSDLSFDLLKVTAPKTAWANWLSYFFSVGELTYSQHLTLLLQTIHSGPQEQTEVFRDAQRLEELLSVPRHKKILEELLRQTTHASVLSNLNRDKEIESFFKLFNLLQMPIPIPDLQVALSQFEKFSNYLPQVASYTAAYADLTDAEALSWLRQVAQARQRSKYVNTDAQGKPHHDNLYDLCRGLSAPDAELIGYILAEIVTLPEQGYNHLTELEYWLECLHQISESDLNAYPHLAVLVGHAALGINSYWEATRKISPNGNHVKLFLLFLDLVSQNDQERVQKELEFEDVWQLVQLTQNGESKAQHLLPLAIEKRLISTDFVRRLIAFPDGPERHMAISLLAYIARESAWKPLLYSLPQEIVVGWLSLVSSGNRARYASDGKDVLYDLASEVYRDWPPLLSLLIDNVTYLPEPLYQKENEYSHWLTELDKIVEKGSFAKLPENLCFLLGERRHNLPRYGENIPILYHFSISHLVARTTGNIPDEDVYRLFSYSYGTGREISQHREFQKLREQVIEEKRISVQFIDYLSKKDVSQLPIIAFGPEWEPYRRLLNVEQTIKLADGISPTRSPQELYELLKEKFTQLPSGSLVWRIVQLLPDLPKSSNEKLDLLRDWVEKAKDLVHMEGSLYQFIRPYDKGLTFWDRTRQTQNPEGLFLLTITDWFNQQDRAPIPADSDKLAIGKNSFAGKTFTTKIPLSVGKGKEELSSSHNPLRIEDVTLLVTLQREDLLQRGYQNEYIIFDERLVQRLVRTQNVPNDFARTLYEFYQHVLKTSAKPVSDALLWSVLRYLLPFFRQQDVLNEQQAQDEYASWIEVVRQWLIQKHEKQVPKEETRLRKNLVMLSYPEEDTELFAISNAGSDPLGRVFFIMAFQYLDRQGFVELSEQDRQAYQKIARQEKISVPSPARKNPNRSPLLFIVPGAVMTAAIVVALILLLSRLGFPIPFFSNPLATTVRSLVFGIEPTATPTPIPPATPTLLPTPTITTTPTPTSTSTITVTPSPTALPTMQDCEFLIDKDPFVIEAEHFFSSSQGSGEWTNYLWQLMTEVNATDTRGGVMQVLNSDPGQPKRRIEMTDLLSSPKLVYRLFFTVEGKYYLYVRGKGADTSDSIYISFDNTILEDARNQESFLTGFDDDKFKWQLLLQEINISSPGFHEIALHMREEGMIVDTLLLSTSPREISNNDDYGLGPSPNTSQCRE